MSASYAVKKLQELNEEIKDMSPKEVQELFEERPEVKEKILDIHSPEFLKET